MYQFRRFALLALALASVLVAKEDPVHWNLSPAVVNSAVAPGGTTYYKLDAAIESGWHLYSPTTPPGGPTVTKVQISPNPSVDTYKVFRPQPVRKLDPNFNLDTETYTNSAEFLIAVSTAKAAPQSSTIEATVRYQVCSDVKCLPPVRKTITAPLNVQPGAAAAPFSLPQGYALVTASATQPGGTTAPNTTPSAPVNASSVPVTSSSAAGGTFPFLLTAFGFGLAALFTPCVFPMIPITISFFLNQNAPDQPRRRGWIQALVFCVGIVVLFTGLGLLVTTVAGPFGVVQLGSSPWVNGFISAVFLVFGLSLLGAFELRLPSGLLTRLSSTSQTGGIGGSLLMGLTFSLTSFACIGPIVGPLLIASVQSKGALPVLGMLAFAVGLAAPFFLLALFPTYLERLPRSGSWMLRVKVVLGFVVLAVMLKYLSNVDQVLQLHWLTRERFLAAWIVLFALPGLYLLGLLPMEGIKRDERVGVARALVAALFLIFSISLIPGLFGGRLGDLDAFVPESSGSLFAGTPSTAAQSSARFTNDLDRALAAANEEHKLVLVNFTGYACTNCHWMKANMFPRPEIQAALKDLVVVDLYTDGTDAESDKNQQFEDRTFGTASIPFYALLDGHRDVIATFPQLTRNPQEFLAFLEKKPNSGPQTAMLR